jgi:uncharacterized membrane protein
VRRGGVIFAAHRCQEPDPQEIKFRQEIIVFETIVSSTRLPNLHPAVIHFPVALLLTAVLADAVGLVRRGWTWLDRPAAILYLLGTLGALGAYLTGRSAANGLGLLSPAAEASVTAHSDWALRTLLYFAAFSLARTWPAWRDRRADKLGIPRLRAVGLALALFGAWMLFETADRGGGLVYEHGLAVAAAPVVDGGEQHAAREDGGEPSPGTGPAPGVGPVREEDGTLRWTPGPGAGTAIDSTLRIVGISPDATVEPVTPEGLVVRVSGRALILLPDSFGDVRVEAAVDWRGFQGTLGLVHHARGAEVFEAFEVAPDGALELARYGGGGRSVLGKGDVGELKQGIEHVAVSAVGSHFKGYVDGRTEAHGHGHPIEPGRAGLLVDGNGEIRILALEASPVRE